VKEPQTARHMSLIASQCPMATRVAGFYPFGSAAPTAAALRQSGLAESELRDIDRNNIRRIVPGLISWVDGALERVPNGQLEPASAVRAVSINLATSRI